MTKKTTFSTTSPTYRNSTNTKLLFINKFFPNREQPKKPVNHPDYKYPYDRTPVYFQHFNRYLGCTQANRFKPKQHPKRFTFLRLE